jgi:hypothetical protein
MDAALEVNCRVADKDGFCGTVRYLGPVATSKSADTVYVGIEWDVVTRGKGDGSVTTSDGETVRYFSCSGGRTASFLKPELVSLGRPILEAMSEKYEGSAGSASSFGGIADASGNAIPMQLVGGEKVRSRQALDKLTHVAVSEQRVSSIPSGCLAGAGCGARLQELDLR